MTNYQCSAEEWVYARSYTRVAWADTGNYKENWLQAKWFVWIGVLLVAAVIGSNVVPNVLWNVIIIGCIAAVPVLLVMNARKVTRNVQEKWVIPEQGQHVAWLKVTPEQLLVNMYNRDESTWYGIRWEHLRFIQLDEVKAKASQVQWAEINFKQAKSKLPRFAETAKVHYEDRFHLELYTHANKISWIAVPPSWVVNGTLRALLQEIERVSGKGLDRDRVYTANTQQMINRYL